MIPASFVPYLIKLIAPQLTEMMAKTFKLPQVLSYMELPNDTDLKVEKLETQVKMLAEDQHPPIFTEEELLGIKDRLIKLEEFETQVRRKKAFKRKDG